MARSQWSVAEGSVADGAYLIVRRGDEDICTATFSPTGAPVNIEFTELRHATSNRTRIKAVDMLVEHAANRVA